VNRSAKVELFEHIRREYEFGGRSVRSIAKELGVHRRMVRQALENALPPDRKAVLRPAPRLDPVKEFIEEILRLDQRAPRKQRHTAHRIWVRLCQEAPTCPVAESTIRAYVRRRKQELGWVAGEVHIPQCYGFGQEAQVDWYEAFVVLDGERVKVQVFVMRSMKSGAAFHRAYLHATQQAFLEAHEGAFEYFGGVFGTLRYDNLGSAVKKILRGYTRDEHTRFVAFRSHWGFLAQFCSPKQPQEKGGVESEVGTYRRNHLVPMPEAKDLCALNGWLLEACREDESRRLPHRESSVGELLRQEREHLGALAAEGFDLAEGRSCVIDGKGCVLCHTNWYSTPLGSGTRAQVRVLPSEVQVWYGGKQVAWHERSYGRGQYVLNLEHYLDVLQRKPGALSGSVALAQWREAGRWPASFDELWEGLMQRQGKQDGTRALIDLLLLARQHSFEALKRAVEESLKLGCIDASAVRCLLLHPGSSEVPARLSVEELGALSRYERPAPTMSEYDQLLGVGR
jgi:transposase